ncbi:MAG: hypothetical protein AAB728_02990 [Patescibacteria group bacterium]
MRFSPALLLVLLPVSIAPAGVLAYATPEDVLLQQLQYYQSQNYLPPNSRRVRELNEQQEAARAAQHPSTFVDMGNEDAPVTSSSSSSATQEAAAPSLEEAEEDVSDEALDAATLRLLERLENEDALHTNATAQQQDSPLAPTGLGTLAALGIAMVGIGITLLKARKG